MEQYRHISEMEKILDGHQAMIHTFNRALTDFEKSQEEYRKLMDYYGSERFFDDVEQSNAGLIPNNIKCGVLSEDAVFNMIGENFDTAVRMLEIATVMIKAH